MESPLENDHHHEEKQQTNNEGILKHEPVNSFIHNNQNNNNIYLNNGNNNYNNSGNTWNQHEEWHPPPPLPQDMRSYNPIEQDEMLSNAVRHHPCLYDNKHEHYKNKTTRQRAWNQIAAALSFVPDGEEASHMFETLKKRYSRKKVNYRRTQSEGASAEMVKRAKEVFLGYTFMQWLEPYIRFRSMKNSAAIEGHNETILHEENDEQIMIDDSPHEVGYQQESMTRRKRLASPSTTAVSKQSKRHDTLPTQVKHASSSHHHTTAITHQMFPIGYHGNHQQPFAQTLINDEDELFTACLLAQLRKLDERQKCSVKHDINNIVYKAVLQSME